MVAEERRHVAERDEQQRMINDQNRAVAERDTVIHLLQKNIQLMEEEITLMGVSAPYPSWTFESHLEWTIAGPACPFDSKICVLLNIPQAKQPTLGTDNSCSSVDLATFTILKCLHINHCLHVSLPCSAGRWEFSSNDKLLCTHCQSDMQARDEDLAAILPPRRQYST